MKKNELNYPSIQTDLIEISKNYLLKKYHKVFHMDYYYNKEVQDSL